MLDILTRLTVAHRNMNNIVDGIQIEFSSESLLALNICLGYIMYGIALDLKKEDFALLLRQPKKALVGLLSQYVVFPLLTFLMMKILQPHPSIALGMILVAACPGGNMSNFITHTAHGNTALSVSLTAFSTVLAPVMTPFLFSFYGNLDSETAQLLKTIEISFGDVFQTMLTLLILPLIAGILTSRFFPKFTEQSKRFFKVTSLLLFFSFIALALMKNYTVFIDYIYLVVGIVFIQDLIGFVSGYGLGHIFGLQERDKRALSIESGIHNTGLGLILIFNFFGGMGGMALIAAWWGIWHLIAGIGLAYYWQKRPVTA